MTELDRMFSENPEEWNGLLVYPVLTRDYHLFLTAKDAITAAQQGWPYPWSAMKYLEGLAGMGLLPRLALMLKLTLRLQGEDLPIYPKTDGETLKWLRVIQGDRIGDITPRNFGALRELIAWQNGLELPNETNNTELVEAQKDLSKKDGVALKADLEALVYSVALKTGVSPREVMEWTVRRFQATERAIDRAEGHRMAGITLAAGGKFKGGNPYPSWKYDREEQTNSVEPLSALSGRLAGSVEQK